MKTQTKPIRIQLPRGRKSMRAIFGSLTALAAVLALLGGPSIATAQTENFDSGAAIFNPGPDQWIQANVLAPIGGSVNNSFPANGSGLALRLQRGSADMSVVPGGPFPQPYGTGRAWIYRTNDYTDFYIAMDLVNWNDATNQAMVLLARATGFNDAPLGLPGLGAVNGYVFNYDNRQDGQNPGDRNGGELQINVVTGEAPDTIAAAEVTLTPGRSYRLVFKGVGSTLTGQLYDSEDLTKPIVTIVTVDATYPAGKSGIVTFCREDDIHPNSTDETVDNYYAASSDPNTDIAPAIRHPIAGTPQVVTRTPANRFTNLHPAASGISFTAQTFTAGQINASATKLYLNGVDASASLAPLPANGSTVSFTTAAATLAADTVYSARIVLEDTTGTLKTTNTFWFDTFSDSSLATAPVRTIESEDYNYENGRYQLGTIPVSGMDTNGGPVNGSGVGYFESVGTAGVDYSKPAGAYNLILAEYRPADRVQITQGSVLFSGEDNAADILDAVTVAGLPAPYRINDTQRSQYVATNVLEYQVRLTSPGDWMNYTRSFAPTNYNVYLRCASFGATTVYLDQVTSDPTTTNQTTVRLGSFDVGNHIMRLNYQYEPLMAGSERAVVCFNGTNTLRLTMGGTPSKDERLISLDYLLFVPTSASTTVADDFNDGSDTFPTANWTHVDAISTATGGASTPNTYDASSGKYRLQAAPSPNPGTLGPARTMSIAPCAYTDFYVSVDVTNWDMSVVQAFGLVARGKEFGPGTTDGYLFGYASGGTLLPGGSYITITRVQDDLTLVDVHGSGADGDALMKVELDPTKEYRMVFMGHGTHLEGRVYELPDTTTPIAVVSGNTAPDSTILTSGSCGLTAFNLASATGVQYAGPVDVTFDNYYAAVDCPTTFYTDNFNDGNDTNPPPAWVHYDPLGGISAAPASFTFPDGHYRIASSQLDPDCNGGPPDHAGPARAGSVRPGVLGSFYVSVDLIDWDDTVRQAFGILARGNTIGLGTTTGYLFSYEMGGGTLPNDTGGDLDMSPLVGEGPIGQIETTPSGIHLTKGKQYRMTFSGAGNNFVGRIYDLAAPLSPIKTVLGTDNRSAVPYTSGQVGLVVASQSSCVVGGDATFDNFVADVAEPVLSFDGSSGTAVISWPGNLTCLWVLESSPSVGADAVWTEVPTTTVSGAASKIVFDPVTVQNSYTATSPMEATGNTYYRLRKL